MSLMSADAPDAFAVDSGPAAFRRAGPFVVIAGTGPDAESGADIRAQTQSAIANIRETLESAGGALENLVEVTTYLASMSDFAGYNECYAEHFSSDGPARTTVAVDRLPHEGQLIEISCVAYIMTNLK